jgi:hypothetical protein
MYGAGVRILLVTPPPVHHSQRLEYQIRRYGTEGATGILERTLENTGLYASKCAQVAQELQLPVVNLFEIMQLPPAKPSDATADNGTTNEAFDWGAYFCDGLHFYVPAGHDIVAQSILTAIQEHYPEIAVTPDPRTEQFANSNTACAALSIDAPYHDQIDHLSHDKSFEEFYRNLLEPPVQSSSSPSVANGDSSKKAKLGDNAAEL